jgi:hypothetical protein
VTGRDDRPSAYVNLRPDQIIATDFDIHLPSSVPAIPKLIYRWEEFGSGI